MANNLRDHCAFCGIFTEMDGEHQFDNWMRNYIPRTKKFHERIIVTIDESGTEKIVERIKGDPANRKIPCVCRPCNNGWMSKATSGSKPTVKGLIKGDNFRISSDEQKKLRHWIAIKIIASDYGQPSTLSISEEDKKFVYKNRDAPPNWRIWIGHIGSPGHTTFYRKTPYKVDLFGDTLSANSYRTEFNTHAATYAVENMLIHVIISAHDGIFHDWRMPLQIAGRLREISNISGFGIVWPPPALTPEQLSVVILAFQRFMSRLAVQEHGVCIPEI
jgi:hypothetical protein